MEGFLLLSIYVIAAVALLVSINNYFEIKELKDKQKETKANNAWDHYHDRTRQVKPVIKTPWN